MNKQDELKELRDLVNHSNKLLEVRNTQEYKDFELFLTGYFKIKKLYGGYERIAIIAGTKTGKARNKYLLDIFKIYNDLFNSLGKDRYEKMTKYCRDNNIGNSINDNGDVYDLSTIDEFWNCYDSLKDLLSIKDEENIIKNADDIRNNINWQKDDQTFNSLFSKLNGKVITIKNNSIVFISRKKITDAVTLFKILADDGYISTLQNTANEMLINNFRYNKDGKIMKFKARKLDNARDKLNNTIYISEFKKSYF